MESLTCAASLLFRGSSHSDASLIGVLIFLFLILLVIAIEAAGGSKTRRRSGTGGSTGRSGGTYPQVALRQAQKRIMFCGHCGKRVGDADAFCTHCGSNLRVPTQDLPPARAAGTPAGHITIPPVVVPAVMEVKRGMTPAEVERVASVARSTEVPRESGSPQGTAAVVSLVASHLKSAFPKTTFEVCSHHADVIHVGWKGTPQTDEARSYLQTLRLSRQIPNVDFNFHHIDSEEPSPSSASGGKDHVGESLSHLEQSARGALGGDTGIGNMGLNYSAGGGGGKMNELDLEIINKLDAILVKYRQKIAELKRKDGVVGGDDVAREEAIQILMTLEYKASEAKRLVAGAPAGLTGQEIVQWVFKRTR